MREQVEYMMATQNSKVQKGGIFQRNTISLLILT